MTQVTYDPWHAALLDLLHLTQQAQDDQVAECVSAALRPLGMETTCYLVDEEQRHLHPLAEHGKQSAARLGVEGTVAGRAFTTVDTQRVGGGLGSRLWVPLVDGTERLGVVEIVLRRDDCDIEALQDWCESYVGLVGHLLAVKMPYGDSLQQVRRTRPMTVAGELLLSTLPPLTFTSDRLVLSALLEPHYDIGGDAFDYALDGETAWFCVLDGMGRGLHAAVMTVTALAAIRAARRDDRGLYAIAQATEDALRDQFEDTAYVTGLLCELHTGTGRLRYISAGHPAPLLLRRGRAVRELTGGRRLPLGLDDSTIEVAEEMLEPGDRLLLYTDGVIEAGDRWGEMFGVERLVDLTEQAAQAKLPAPETLRGLAHRVASFRDGPPRDDAMLMLVEWSAEAARRVLP
ncbi:PP2C family protein-serine/threonine phosphatase [Catellatospora sichuanensis]|uniref:PP2C family protein-serine/threonine phosphatase n=1 Tax=Catellatospora sichuanensis TaxID=1969805 RepID=UPI001181DC1B|nr:PP2C family protein-serine/threonine phosphatase [Catellatospora sichuanensis]